MSTNNTTASRFNGSLTATVTWPNAGFTNSGFVARDVPDATDCGYNGHKLTGLLLYPDGMIAGTCEKCGGRQSIADGADLLLEILLTQMKDLAVRTVVKEDVLGELVEKCAYLDDLITQAATIRDLLRDVAKASIVDVSDD